MSTNQPQQDGERFGAADPYVAGQGDLDQPKKKGWFGSCLIGCLVVGVIMAVLCGIVGFIAYKQGPSIAVNASREVVKVMLEESELPLEEQEAVLTQFDRVGDAFVAGDLSWEESFALMEDFAQSPAMTFVVLFGIEHKYLENSGLSEEEREDAKQTMTRIMRAVMEDELSSDEIQELSNVVMTNPGTEKARLKEVLSDQELRDFFAQAKAMMDEKEIPFEESTTNISDKIKEIVDKHLGGTADDDLDLHIQVDESEAEAEAEPIAVP